MARYGDLERLEHHFDYCATESRNNCDEWGAKCFEMARNATKNQPTADVVPKSEVEELIRKQIDLHEECSGLKKAKQEVAREIFEEIEKTVFADMDFFKELKKKYTEGDK